MAAIPATELCPERQRLVGLLTAIDEELNHIHEAEQLAILHNDMDEFDCVQVGLARMRQYHKVVVESLRQHTREHGC